MDDVTGLRASRRHQALAAAVTLALVATVVCVVPIASVSGPVIAAFLPLFAMAVLLTDGITAYLLGSQFVISREPFLASLSGAYAFTAITVTLQLLMFPGVFSAQGLLGASAQSAVWMWVFWHGGFPFLLLSSACVRRQTRIDPIQPNRLRLVGLLCIGIPLLLAAGGAWLAAHCDQLLPPLIAAGGSYRTLSTGPIGPAIIAINLVTVIAICVSGRFQTTLDVWLAVAALANLVDASLTLLGSARYSIGWYAARAASVVASTTVLSVLLWEINRLYRGLQRAHARLQEFSIRDGLTGVYNRRFFDERYAREIERAKRTGRPLSVLMVDVDYFKLFNDTHGHQRGDECLIAVATAISRQAARPGDFVARYGGEEFVLVLPDTDRAGAATVSERVRDAVSALRIPTPTPSGIVTLSVGASTIERPPPATDALLRAADTALYMAKNSGRNRVCFSDVAVPAS
ncbi:GGDEF domain-containing protein [Pararobbsia silviterrae]|nr:sensor domain-containing diguanylate cyclase [Pararobbsia silviterrae]